MNATWTGVLGIALVLNSTVALLRAAEPNEYFGQSTVLAPGVRTVSDSLLPGTVSFPDTVLGIRGFLGDVYFVDDDGSPLGDGRASGAGNVPTNSGSIDFVISGWPDNDFFGNHTQFGEYTVYVDAYDFFGDLVDSFNVTTTLQPGNVDEYSYSDFNWINGSYDVYIDNTVGGVSGADIDFFTFTGLTPGRGFTIETTQSPSTSLDTLLGWFNDAGSLLSADDDSGSGYLSLLTGIVPTSGKLTFAVTGHGDDSFAGSHSEGGEYDLVLTVAGSPGDFDGDGDVDGRDFLRWQRDPGVGTLAEWQTHYGTPLMPNVSAVPEPGSIALLLAVLGGIGPSARRR